MAIRSPSPPSPAKVKSDAPAAMPSRPISARPRVMRAAFAESPDHAIRHPCGECDNVLQRACEFHAYYIRVGVDAKSPARQKLLGTLGRYGVARGNHGGGGTTHDYFFGEVWARERARPSFPAWPQFFSQHLGHPLQRANSRPFDALMTIESSFMTPRYGLRERDIGAHRLRGHDHEEHFAIARASSRSDVRMRPGGMDIQA